MKEKNESKIELTTTASNTIEEKLAKLKELAVVIDLNNRVLSKEERSEYENLTFKLEFNLSELVKKYKLEEADTKIHSMNQVIKLLKNQ